MQRNFNTRSWRPETADITCFGLANWKKLEKAGRDGRRTVSITMMNEKSPRYEAVALLEQGNRSQLLAFGFRFSGVYECKVGCIIDHEGANAVLV